ncbi:glycosyltransferase [Vibrio mytili]|uniref:glycosyltransferase n=1 Tax=Vibrio mytili TaxID=50718 RepID=UPI002F41C1A0
MNNNIYVIQPIIPHYRVPFFKILNDKLGSRIYYYICDKDLNNLSTDEAALKFNNVYRMKGFINFKRKVYWCTGLPFSHFKKNDVVVIPGNPRVINYMLLFLYLKFKGIKVVWWGQGWTSGSRSIAARLRRWIMLKSDVVMLYTQKEADYFTKHNHVYALNNGLDVASVPYSYSDKSKQKKLSLLFIGRLTEKSKFSLLLQALSECEREVDIHIIGFTQEECDVKHVNDRVNFVWHGAIYTNAEIYKISLNCHAFIYPGAVGLSLIHAFANGLPALVHDSEFNHMPEFSAFKEHFNGLSFAYNNSSSLKHLIETCSIDELSQMSVNARNTVVETYNICDMARRFFYSLNGII